MSEQNTSFMQQLDEWTATSVVEPLVSAAGSGDPLSYAQARAAVVEAIRNKVRESYYNGRQAGPRLPSGGSYGRRNSPITASL